ncbi:hypothetical protein ABZ468_55450 [Streptomyces sp. NPDC005708]|uniref:hypothetical protein n=1 Tax=Streptomyces sp. NPDC005708 TaxID=3154564 RepID=UPI0033D407AD
MAWTAACWAANARSAATSLERGGIRHPAVLHETLTERSPWPVSRTVHARPGVCWVEGSL